MWGLAVKSLSLVRGLRTVATCRGAALAGLVATRTALPTTKSVHSLGVHSDHDSRFSRVLASLQPAARATFTTTTIPTHLGGAPLDISQPETPQPASVTNGNPPIQILDIAPSNLADPGPLTAKLLDLFHFEEKRLSQIATRTPEEIQSVQDCLKRLTAATANCPPSSALVELYKSLAMDLEENKLSGELAEIAKDIVHCPSIKYLYEGLTSNEKPLHGDVLSKAIRLAIRDAPKNLNVTEFVALLLKYGRDVEGRPLEIERSREELARVDKVREQKYWADDTVDSDDDGGDDNDEPDVANIFPEYDPKQKGRPSAERKVLAKPRRLWKMLTSNAHGVHLDALGEAQKPLRITTLRPESSIRDLTESKTPDAIPGDEDDGSVLKLTVSPPYIWFVQDDEREKQNYLDDRSLFLRTYELPGLMQLMMYTLSPVADRDLTSSLIAGDSGIGKSTLINLMLMVCAVFGRNLVNCYVNAANTLEYLTFVSHPDLTKAGWICVQSLKFGARVSNYPMNTSLWVDLRRTTNHETAREFMDSIYGSIWSLSPRHVRALRKLVRFSHIHWMDEWPLANMRVLAPFVCVPRMRKLMQDEEILRILHTCLGGSIRNLLDFLGNPEVSESSFSFMLATHLQESANSAREAGVTMQTAENGPNSMFIHHKPEAQQTQLPPPGRSEGCWIHTCYCKIRRNAKSQFRSPLHGLLMYNCLPQDTAVSVLKVMARGEYQLGGQAFENAYLNLIMERKTLAFTMKKLAREEFSAFAVYKSFLNMLPVELNEVSQALKETCYIPLSEAKRVSFNPSSDVGHEAPGRNVATKTTTSRKKGARGASQTVATSPRSQHAIDPVFLLDTIKMYARRNKPVWLSPTKDNLKDHDAILYIPPSCDEIAGIFRGEATKASAESKAEVGITNMHSEASHTHGKPNCDRRTALPHLGTIVLVQIKSGGSIGYSDLSHHVKAVGKLRSELVELLPMYSSQLPDADVKQAHVESLFILSAHALRETQNQKLKAAAEKGEVGIVDDAVQHAFQLSPLFSEK